jgi:alginate O-acetyltransferase complex protein AlgI
MVFSSETFLFLFLPVFLIAYYLTPSRYRNATLLAESYLFYGWWRMDFLGLLVLNTIWSYVFSLLIDKYRDTQYSRILCAIGVTGCLLVLGVFKYLNFFIDSFASLVGKTPAEIGVHWHLLLPIGVSFYVFHSISYMVDVKRGDAKVSRNIVDFAAFLALFPQLVAGPILRYKDLAPQFAKREHSWELFNAGWTRFLIGLAKKVLIADSVAPLADAMFGVANPTMSESWIGALAYTMQLYFDFAGYSDMAIGLALMMGFKFAENFNLPYISRSITEFWRRWHISLSVWLRDYLYIPLGGNRHGVARMYINLFLVMLLGGLWHGANWTFVLWGVWHGGFLVLERYLGWPKKSETSNFALPLTFLVVVIGWVMFRSPNVADAMRMYSGMVGVNGFSIRPEIEWQISHEALAFLAFAIALAIAEPFLRKWDEASAQPIAGVQASGVAVASINIVKALALAVIVTAALMKLAEQSYSPFLYFQF